MIAQTASSLHRRRKLSWVGSNRLLAESRNQLVLPDVSIRDAPLVVAGALNSLSPTGPLRIPDDAGTVDLFSILTRKKKGPDATFSQLARWPLRRHSSMPVYRGYLIHLNIITAAPE